MDEEGIIALIVLAVVGYIIYLVAVFANSFKKASERNRLAAEAAAVQQGHKPMGSP